MLVGGKGFEAVQVQVPAPPQPLQGWGAGWEVGVGMGVTSGEITGVGDGAGVNSGVGVHSGVGVGLGVGVGVGRQASTVGAMTKKESKRKTVIKNLLIMVEPLGR
jgi:hypothetical protein